MTARKKNNRKSNPSACNRRQARQHSNGLNFEKLEARQLLAAITVSNATDILSPTADTSSIAALVASDGGDGISLREAATAANNTAGEDAITFDASVFTGGDNNLIRLTQGELSISDSLAIDGSSVGGVVITGDANDDDITVAGSHITDVEASFGQYLGEPDDLLSDNSRVLNFTSSTGSLTLTDLTITGGRLTEMGQSGAGIRSIGNLSLINSDVNGNSTFATFGNGGGIFSSSGDVSLTNSTVRGNSAAIYNSHGGGIFISDGDVSLIDSTVSENSLTGSENRGGGIYVSNGNALLSNSTISGNIISNRFISNNDNRGGGIYIVNGDVSLTNSVVSGNDSFRSSGGGISSSIGNVSLINSTVSGNSSVNTSGGGISNNNGDVSLISSTVSGNIGGGISSRDGSLSVINSTISGNSLTNFRYGGGISSSDSTVQIINSTVTANSAYREGGGISFNVNTSGVAGLSIQNSIVAGNTTSRSESPDLRFRDRSYTNDLVVEYSLIGDTDDSGVTTATGTGNILNTSALLSPLADNGGTTQTHALLLDSPAINTGDDALALDESGNPLTIDQRGENRFFGAVDMGAFELQVEGNIETRSLVVTTNLDVEDPDDGVNSLREAIAFANDPEAGRGRDGDADGDGSVSDAITFDPNVFSGGDDNLIRLTQGELVITQGASIDASLVGGLLITGDADDDDITVFSTHITDVVASFGGTTGAADDLLDDNSRVFNFSGSSSDTLTLSDLIITGGRVTSLGATTVFGAAGGGIYISYGNVALINSTVSGNSSPDRQGGGVFTYRGDLSLTSSTVSLNSGNGGGGISSLDGDVSLTNSTVSNNSSTGIGGGIDVGNDADLVLTNSTVSGNVSFFRGGGIMTSLRSVLILTNSTVSNNRVIGVTGFRGGGGIYTFASDVTLVGSTVSGNSTTDDGGGIHAFRGDVSLTDSTVNGNNSSGDGGGFITFSTDVSLTNSTVSGNSSSGGNGGGLWSEDSRITLLNSTLTGNSAARVGGGLSVEDNFSPAASLTLYNSIIAGNVDNGTAPDVLTESSVLNDLIVENSLLGNTTGSGITIATGSGNILNQLPLLGPLADNGGSTQTHALLAGSLAINSGSNAIVTDAGLTTDQRAENRIQFGTVDIGAFESDFNERNLVVTTNLDIEDPNDGFTSLREAIVISNEGSETSSITFDPSVFSVPTAIEISSQLPTITDTLTLTGLGADLLTIDALAGGNGILDGDGFRIFEVNDGDENNSIEVSISGLTLTGGDNNDSGGAISNFENLNLDGVAIVGNRASFGGGISNELSGVLTISNSTVANNEASEGGGIFTGGELAATNTTISSNSAAGSGGAIVSAGDSAGNTLSLTNATLANNTGNGGVHFNNGNGSTTATFNNTILDSSITGIGNNGTTLTGGNNLFAGADPGITGAGNLFNQTSLLGPLTDNGGPTLTHALLYGSPAINAGDSTLAVDTNGNPLTTDQRGEDRVRFGSIDIGAVETEFVEARSLVVTTAQDVVDASDGVTSLREAIAFAFAGFSNDGDADGDGLRADTITFDASVFNGGDNSLIRLVQGELSISDSLTIDGSSVGGIVITGDAAGNDITVAGSNITDVPASTVGTGGTSTDLLGDNSRVFDILDSDLFGTANVNLKGLTITGGRATSNEDGGGIRFNSSGILTLSQSTVSGNTAAGSNADGGGIHARSGDVLLTNSSVTGNVSGGNGGGIGIAFGRLASSNSTVSGNVSGRDGGGIWFNESPIQLVNNTVTDNSASRVGGGISFGNGNVSQVARLTLLNSIASGNTDNGTAPDVEAVGNVINGQIVESSLIGDTLGSGITTASGTGNILNQTALLGPLADNGGPTLTHALLSGSTAINAGSNAIATAAGLTADQRGESRIRLGSVDIGAFESDFNELNLIVTTSLDVTDPNDGLTSLREAIVISNESVSADTIQFTSSVFSVPATIEISSQLPTITDELTISGFGADLLTIDAQGGGDNLLDGNGFRIFEVNDGDVNNSVDVSISGLTLTGGDNNDSGGAISNFENLNLDGVAIVGNRASFGGGISNELSGVLTISNSTIANNEASVDGGGIFTGGELAATNTTISSNSAAGSGGAIVSAGDSSGAVLSLTNATLANNTGNGGVYFNNGNGSTAGTFNNTILDSSITGIGNNGTTLTGGNNLFAGADPGITGTGNLFNQTSLLGPLADNGGPTLTHALLYGSPAINTGDSTLAVDINGNPLTTDQRGEDRVRFGSIDIGAVETEFDEARSLIVTTAQDVVDASDRVTSLREAIAFAFAGFSNDGDADGDGLRADTITFDASVFNGGDNSVIRLVQGELSISDSLTIDGSSVGGVVITGDATDNDITVAGTNLTNVSASLVGVIGASTNLLDDNSRVFDILDSDLFGAANVNLKGLTITGGRATGVEHGGGIRFNSSGTLTLNQSTVSGNIALGTNSEGGGIYARLGDVSLTNTTVSENISISDGGGIRTSLGDLSLNNSTVSGNVSGGDGGGIGFNDSTVRLVNSTVTNNSASDVGGGISFRNSILSLADRLTLHNSIVSGNTDNGTAPDVEAVGNVVDDQVVEHSLIGDTTGSGITASSGSGNLLNQSAMLGPLADNGGPTLSHALLDGSPAINAGDSTLAVDENGNPLTTDQRGSVRVHAGTVDIGAVESEFGGALLLGDASLDGAVNFLDISPFISLVTNSTFLDEADVNRDGSVNFLDISPFIALLSPDVPTQPLLGDANLDESVNFLDISPFISLVTTSTFLDEADVNRDEGVNFLDISPFISVLNSGNTSAAMSQSVVVSPPASSEVSPVSVVVSEPVSVVSVVSSVSVAVTTETLDAKQVDADPIEVSQSIVATESLPQAPLLFETDLLASPVDQTNNLSAVDTAVAVVTPVDTYRRPVTLAPTEYKSIGDRSSSVSGSESNGPLVKQRSLAGSTESLDFSQESGDTLPTANVRIEESFLTAAEFFDAHPETLDEVFDFELEETLVGLIE